MDIESERIMLAAPKTYMNTSGEAVRQLIQTTGVRIERLVVVYDDLDIPLGEIRIRKKGGPGTHRGIESVVREIRTGDFPRIRIGIGPMPSGIEATQYVLAPFSRKERTLLSDALDKAEKSLRMMVSGNIEAAMNAFNTRRADGDKIV